MKLLFYINYIHHGGAERVISNLATQFSENGHEVLLVTSFKDVWEYSYGDKVKRIVLFSEKIDGFAKRNIFLVKKLRSIIKYEKPDVVTAFMGEANFRAIAATAFTKTKCIISVRNDPDREYSSLPLKIMSKTLFGLADGIVFQTPDAQCKFPERISAKSTIIMNQVDSRFFGIKNKNGNDIVTTGRLCRQKNHEMLIKAFASVCNEFDGNLIIYGDGDLKNHLQELISDLAMEKRIFLPGSTNDVVGVLADAKVFVLSSDYEGLPNSLMEAMAAGLPCISTDCPCGGPKLLFGNDNAGILTEVGNVDEMADAIRTLMRNDSLRNNLAAEAKKRSALFMPDVVYKNWDKYVKDTIGEGQYEIK